MRPPLRTTLFIALGALGSSLAIGCKSPPGPPPSEGTAPAATPEAPLPPAGGNGGPRERTSTPLAGTIAPLAPPCEGILAQLRDLDASIPIIFSYSGRSQAELHEDVKQGITLARRFLAECPETRLACEVKAQLARFLLARANRQREEIVKERQQTLKDWGMSPENIEAAWGDEKARIDEEMRAYYRDIRALASAGADAKDLPAARRTGLFVELKLLEQEGRFEDMRRIGRVLLDEAESGPTSPSVHISMASSYLNERRYKEAAEYLRSVIQKRENDPEYVVYNDRLFDALTGLGDLEAMEELAERARVEYPARMESVPSRFLRSIYEQWYYNALFWIGYVRMALGDEERAKAAFRESIAEVEALEARLKAQGKIINNVVKVFLDSRTRDLLQYLEERHGKTPSVLDEKAGPRPVDFELGPFWATEEKLTLAESSGKVVAAVFHTKGFDDYRSKTFLQAIDRLVKDRWGDGLRGVWLSFLTGRPGPEEDRKSLNALRDERKALGVTLPAGYDPDRSHQRLFRNLSATVGSSTFFVFDRKGRYAWYMADPRGIDVAIARRVIARILAEE